MKGLTVLLVSVYVYLPTKQCTESELTLRESWILLDWKDLCNTGFNNPVPIGIQIDIRDHIVLV